MTEACADAGVVIMHMQGTPRTMQENPRYDDVVADVHVGRVLRLVLAAEDLGANGRQPAKDKVLGIDDEPLYLNIRRFGGNGFHIKQSRKVCR